MERIVPGTQLRDVRMSDEDATRLAAETLATFWRTVPDPAGLHPLRSWMSALYENDPRTARISHGLIRHAQDLGERLLHRSSRALLLHGDFQHHNLLRRGSGEWAIIDPKGLIGDPGFEVAAWMYNPPGVTARDDYPALVRRRVKIFSELWEMDLQQLLNWAFVGSALSACWAARESPEETFIHFERGAEQLRLLLP